MSIRFDERVAIVTGAGQGLGRSHALQLAAAERQPVWLAHFGNGDVAGHRLNQRHYRRRGSGRIGSYIRHRRAVIHRRGIRLWCICGRGWRCVTGWRRFTRHRHDRR